ncbi:MAG: hypothetical protein JWR83_2516 [Aeromicrobium sp.]|nr:hypothetical protein [Aeromicrobium sp.]
MELPSESEKRRVVPYFTVVFWPVTVGFVGLSVYAVFFKRELLTPLLIGLVIGLPAFIKGVSERHRYDQRMRSAASQMPDNLDYKEFVSLLLHPESWTEADLIAIRSLLVSQTRAIDEAHSKNVRGRKSLEQVAASIQGALDEWERVQER